MKIHEDAANILAKLDEAQDKDIHAIAKELVNLEDDDGNSLLHYMLLERDRIRIKMLVAMGADFNKENIYGNTPFLIALENRDIASVLLFTKALFKKHNVLQKSLGMLLCSSATYIALADFSALTQSFAIFTTTGIGYYMPEVISDNMNSVRCIQ